MTAMKEGVECAETLLEAADSHAKIMNRVGIVQFAGTIDSKGESPQQRRASLAYIFSHDHFNLLRMISRP